MFSFYPPGSKGSLIDTATVFIRDSMADEYTRASKDTLFDPGKLLKKGKIKTVDEAVDFLADRLLAAPLQDEVRTEVVNYMGGQLTDDKVRGAVWLIMCSPDFQRN